MQQNYINLWPSLITRNMIVDMQHNKYINMRENYVACQQNNGACW